MLGSYTRVFTVLLEGLSEYLIHMHLSLGIRMIYGTVEESKRYVGY